MRQNGMTRNMASTKQTNPKTLANAWRNACKKYATQPAWTLFYRTVTYAEWQKKSFSLSHFLTTQCKIPPQERIALMLPNCGAYPIALFAALHARLVVVNLNPIDQTPAIEHHLTSSGATMVITLPMCLPALTPALKNTKVKHLILANLAEEAKGPKRWLIAAALWWRHKKQAPLPKSLQVHDFSKACLRTTTAENPPSHEAGDNGDSGEAKDLLFIQYTSGTTGEAKGVMLDNENILANLAQIHAHLKPWTDRLPNPTVLTVLPLYHIFALTGNLFTFGLLGAHQILIPNGRDTNSIIQAFKKYPIDIFSGVNTLFRMLLNHPTFAACAPFSLKLVIGGGMAVDNATATAWHKTTGCMIHQAYGLSETSPAVTIAPYDQTAFNGSCGKALKQTELQITNKHGKKQPTGSSGELWVRGPQVMKGYWQNPKATKAACTASGWFKTGDIGYLNEDGDLFLIDRKTDMMNISGFNVAPKEVEEALLNHPAITDVAVFSTPDTEHGEIIQALVVVSQDQEAFDPHALKAYAHTMLAAYKVPQRIIKTDDIPKNHLGKPDKKKLKIKYASSK